MKKAPLLKCLVGLLALSVFALALSSCASLRAASARNAHIRQETKKHVYDMPCQQVWPTARQILFSAGYSVKDTGEGANMTLETEWNYNDQNASSRYLVQGVEPGEEKCKVNFTKNSRSTKSKQTNSDRDLDIEWELLQEVDQDSAMRIREEADAKAQAASNS